MRRAAKSEKGCEVGATHVTVAIRNPAERERVWEGLFLVDTGATDCLVPRQHLESIGLTPRGERRYGLADGGEIRVGVTGGEIAFMGETTWGTIVFGEEGQSRCSGLPLWSRWVSQWIRSTRRSRASRRSGSEDFFVLPSAARHTGTEGEFAVSVLKSSPEAGLVRPIVVALPIPPLAPRR